MDLLTLTLAKQFAAKVAAGFSNVEVNGMDIIFTLNNGNQVTLTVPTPADGVSVTDLNIDDDGSLLCTMSDGSVIDAGGVPFVKPERGVDYWTEQDQEAIQSYIDTSLSQAFYIQQDSEHDTLIFRRINNS